MKILFRLDANKQIGAGHFERCFAIAKGMQATHKTSNLSIVFACSLLPKKYKDRLKDSGIKYIPLPVLQTQSEDAIYLKNQLEAKVDLLCVDHYSLADEWESSIREKCKKLLVIDDLANRKHGDIDFLLDQTFNRTEAAYYDFVSQKTTFLLGSPYALLRQEFYTIRNSKRPSKRSIDPPRKIVLALGAMNHAGSTNILVEFLATLRKSYNLSFSVTILLSSQANELSSLKESIKKLPYITLKEDCTSVGVVYSEADLAIGACGTSSWERCALGLPSLTVTLADNQNEIARQLDEYGAHLYLGHIKDMTFSAFENAFMMLSQTPSLLEEMSKKALQICDGKGVANLIRKVGVANIFLKKATTQDIKTVFKWQSNPVIRQFSRNPNPISWSEHQKWMKAALKSNTRHIYIIRSKTHLDDLSVGMLRLDEHLDGYEISILVDEKFQNQNIALNAIKSIPEQFLLKKIYATVSTANKASQNLFTKAGFKKVEADLFVLKNKEELINEE
ncbi:UDP-2,4-diacetamido-2,4,6-trideoxy-beta-L-altropyranose hydrolase [Pseudoalteromonas phenolica]|uniref:UDP-2,4-diacetamido-2,4, 6-trideoxy-beta-L-altropyranose hydrolase n=1 Tax=Pseudoalteromonas phenolica TaxID=161398 RepID=UPI00110A4622|nr:UDP-2,4-diacetamido-2,4,6-trideoxy-beta-L-altropyranose hydrolase [Pseudoalteromonas phenolica]TMO57486.1 UDP-2,4-diacetamido-2,4,6-trideoxy-beta-L-altropyranose hydrolase [Pseudoalteromonas phenolica]